jgi:ABC-type branched-subunit amino acid transport system substrate-binding protein/outer membrane protein assembly factor BamD (BamD/ComL family)
MIKAISVLVVGIAFVLSGCYPRPTLRVPPEKKVVQDEFYLAELDYEAGNYDKAIENYQLYLNENPKGEKSRVALYRMAKINEERYLYHKALSQLEQITLEYPGHPQLPAVKFDMASIYYRLGEYQKSRMEVSKWLERYPQSPLKGEALFLLGRNYKALGDNPRAFYWWTGAIREFQDSPDRQGEINDRIVGLIKYSPIEDLNEMAKYATGDDYAPNIYYQMASVYLEENKLNEAKEAAMALVRSTPEQTWVTAGRQLLDRIEEELSVKKGAIGCLLPLSGPFAIYGQETLNGIQLGMGIFNRSEGGQSLELIIKDTRGETSEAVSGVEELTQKEKVLAIIGPLASKPAMAAAIRAQELRVPIITLTQKAGITAEGDMVFRNFLTPAKEIHRLLDKAVNEMELRRFAILYPDNPYGRFFMNLFWDKVEEMGGVITAVESYKPDETDFAVEIKKMAGLYFPRPESVAEMLKEMEDMAYGNEMGDEPSSKEEPEPIVDFDAVFIPDNPEQVALIAPQFPFHNIFNVRLLGTSIWQSSELIDTARDYVQGAIFPSGFFAESESHVVREFVELYKESFESEPGILAANGYDTIMILKNLIDTGEIRTKRDFQEKLLQYDDFYGVTGRIAFDDQGEVEKEPVLLTISGKRIDTLP